MFKRLIESFKKAEFNSQKVQIEIWNRISSIEDESVLDDLNVELQNKLKQFYSNKERFISTVNSILTSFGIVSSILIALGLYLINTKELIISAEVVVFCFGLFLVFSAFASLLFKQKLKSDYTEIKEVSYLDFGNNNSFADYVKLKLFVVAYNSAKNSYFLELHKRKFSIVPNLLVWGFLISIVSSIFILAFAPLRDNPQQQIISSIETKLDSVENNTKSLKTEAENKQIAQSLNTIALELDSLSKTINANNNKKFKGINHELRQKRSNETE